MLVNSECLAFKFNVARHVGILATCIVAAFVGCSFFLAEIPQENATGRILIARFLGIAFACYSLLVISKILKFKDSLLIFDLTQVTWTFPIKNNIEWEAISKIEFNVSEPAIYFFSATMSLGPTYLDLRNFTSNPSEIISFIEKHFDWIDIERV